MHIAYFCPFPWSMLLFLMKNSISTIKKPDQSIHSSVSESPVFTPNHYPFKSIWALMSFLQIYTVALSLMMRWVCEWSSQLPEAAVVLVQVAIPCWPQARGIAKLFPCPRHAVSCARCPAHHYRSFCVSEAEVWESLILKTWENTYDLLTTCHWSDIKRCNIHS